MSSRLPPFSQEAERAVLSSMILNAEQRARAIDVLAATDFYQPAHGLIFSAIVGLHLDGKPADLVSLLEALRRSGDLDRVGGRRALADLQRSSGISTHVVRYATVVAELATLRRAIGLAAELGDTAYASDLDGVQALLAGAAETIDAPVETVEATEATQLAKTTEADKRPWAVAGLLRVRDRFGLSGPEGGGKMTLLRQLAVCAASGLQPFTLEDAPRTSALIVDLQEDTDELGDQLRWILGYAGTAYPGDTLHGICRPQGMNLLARSDRRWLEGLVRAHRPSLLVIGPLRKLYRAPERFGKSSEEAADELTRILDDVRVGYDCAIAIEGHAGHDRETWRFRGSSVWLDWFNFGFGLDPVKGEKAARHGRVFLKRWRGDRPPGRPWPRMIEHGSAMPWEDSDQPPIANPPTFDDELM